jgi:hypothetical protein
MSDTINYQTVESGGSFSKTVENPPPCSGSVNLSLNPPDSTEWPYQPFAEFRSENTSRSRSDESFSEIRRSGRIKMTPYYKSSTKVRNFLFPLVRYKGLHDWRACLDEFGQFTHGPRTTEHISWNEIYDLTRYTSYTEFIKPSEHWGDQVEVASQQLMSSIVSDAHNSLDLLTTLAEGKESLLTIMGLLRAAASPLRSFKQAVKALKDPKSISDLWLQYRYGIMPIVLTIQDVMDKMEENGFSFDKKNRTTTLHIDSSPDIPNSGNSIYISYNGSIKISAGYRASFSSGNLRALGKTAFNPLLTAWELVPYSFVVDWFIGIGDWLTAQSFSIGDIASQRSFYLSKRTSIKETTFVQDDYTYTNSVTYNDPPNTWGRYGTFTIGPFREFVTHRAREVEINNYERNIFNPSDVGLQISNGLNLTRFADTIALSMKDIYKLFRNLK